MNRAQFLKSGYVFVILAMLTPILCERIGAQCAITNPCPDQYDPPSSITPNAICNPDDACCDPGTGGPPPADPAPAPTPAAACSTCGSGLPTSLTVPTYWVSEPRANLRLESSLLRYSPSHGSQVEFRLSYHQRGAAQEDSTVFGFGTGWSSSFRAFVVDLRGSAGVYRVHRGSAGYVDYVPGAPQYRDGSIATSIGGGIQIEYRNGAKETFTNSFVNSAGVTLYFLTTRADSDGTALAFNYSNVGGILELTSVTDSDGKSTQIYYENGSFPNQVTKVVDPFSRTNLLTYNAAGFLTNTIGVGGLSCSFQYDSALWQGYAPSVTNMTTPYGTTTFTFGGVDSGSLNMISGSNSINRFVLITLPTGGIDLYEYRLDCSAFLSSTNSPVPSTSPLANTLDNIDQQKRNSFHWTALQTQALSTNNPMYLSTTDYALGRLRHFLIDSNSPDVSCTFSLERAPSPDKITSGQFTWYDHGGKANGNNNIGTNDMPFFVALVLPDGTTRYTRYQRNAHNNITQNIATYSKTDGSIGLRTNAFYFATNNIDLLQHIGVNNEQVVSNYFSAVNTYHQPDASYDALNQQTVYLYNSNRQVTQISRPSGLTTTNTYFSTGLYANWLSTTIEVEISKTNSYTYANNLVYSHTDERGLTTTNFWDNLQRLIGVLYPDGSSTSNQYTVLDMTGTKDRDGNWSLFQYNTIRQKIAETNANGAVTRYGYCSCGMLEQITNAIGEVTSFNYDYLGNRTYTYFPDATVTNWFNSLGQRTVSSIGWGYQTNSYNNQGLLTNVSDSYSTKKAVIFDNEDRPIYITDGNAVMVTNTYDLLGRLATRGYPDGGVEKFGYSARGMTAFTNQIGSVTYIAYDPARRKNFETNANSELLQYYYNAAGDLTNLIDGGGHSILCHFDIYGQVTNKVDQTGIEILRYSYDPAARLTNRWSIAKGDTAYAYDPVGNLTNVAYHATHGVVFKYDGLNRLTQMVDGVGTNNYTYTTSGQLATEGGVFASDTLTNTYLNRLRTALSLAQLTGSWTNGFIYDAAGRLTNVTSQAGSFGYTLGGASSSSPLPKAISLPNTSSITNAFDAVARLTASVLIKNTGTILDSAIYGYNTAGQRTTFTNAAGTYVQYTYDNIGQLKTATSSVSSENRGYGADPCWNLNWRTNNGASYNYLVDTKNQLTNAYSATYSYDGNGNLVSGTNGHTAYVYDDENRLVQWFWYAAGSGNCTNGALRTDFVYDGLGRLRKRIEYSATNSTSGGGGTGPTEGLAGTSSGSSGCSWTLGPETHYIYDGKRVIQERDGYNNLLVDYTRGPDLSGSLEGAGGIGGLLARSDQFSSGNPTRHNYYHSDGNGNITYLVNSSQGLAASYRYDPFGNTISSSGTLASFNVYRFSSKEVHVNSGMYCYLYRFYDPNLQRWRNADPVTEWAWNVLTREMDPKLTKFRFGEDNLYRFVMNDPGDSYDPLGLLDSVTAWILGCLKSPQGRADPASCFCIIASDEKDCKNSMGACLCAAAILIPDPITGKPGKPSKQDICKCGCEVLFQDNQQGIDNCKKQCDKLK